MAPQNQYLADLANAYKLVNEIKANDQAKKGLQAQKPPSDEEVFQKLTLQKQFDQGQTVPDIQAPPNTTPAPATNIEGGTIVTRPSTTPNIEGGGTKYSQPGQPVESVASAVRRSMSAAGTLETQPSSASTPNNYGGGGGLGKNGLLGPFGGSGLGGGGNLAADDVTPASPGSSSANAVAIAQNPLAVKGIGGITNSFKIGGAASGVGISAVIGALDAAVHGKSPVVGALSAGGGALATGAIIGGGIAVGVTGGLPAIAVVGTALAGGNLVSNLISSLLTPAPQPKQEAPKPPAPKATQDVEYDIYGESITDNGNPFGGYDSSGKSAGKPGAHWMTTLKGPGFTVALDGGDKGQWYVYNDAGDKNQAVTGGLAIFHEVATLAGAYAQSLTITGIVPHGKPAPPYPPQDLPPLTPLSDSNYVQQSVGNLGQTATPPISPPPDVPLEKNKQKPQTLAVAPNTPATITPPGTTVPGSPNGTNISVNPDGSISVAPVNGQKYGVTTGGDGTEPVTIKTSGNQDVVFDPTNSKLAQGTLPNTFNPTVLQPHPLKATDPFTPTSLQPTSLSGTGTTPGTTTTPTTGAGTTTQAPTAPFFAADPNVTIPLAVLAGLTPLIKNLQNPINQIASQTTPEKLEAAATAGVCNSTKPGGCNAGLNENAKAAADNSANNSNILNNILQLLQLLIDTYLVPIYNNTIAIISRLGAPLAGGISGQIKNFRTVFDTFKEGFDKFVEWSKPGRILSMLTFLTALHNAFMLSSTVKQTLVQLVEDWIKVIDPIFGVDPNKTPLDLNKLLDKTIEQFFEGIIGEPRVKKFEQLFKTSNRIYQAATNLLNNFQMLIFGITSALEIIAHSVHSIGNALKKYGVVGHNAYAWMNPNPNLKNKWVGAVDAFTHKVTGFIAGAFAIDAIAQGILQGRQAVDEIAKQKDELKTELYKAYGETEDIITPPEHKATAEAAKKSATDSKGKLPTEDTIRSLGG